MIKKINNMKEGNHLFIGPYVPDQWLDILIDKESISDVASYRLFGNICDGIIELDANISILSSFNINGVDISDKMSEISNNLFFFEQTSNRKINLLKKTYEVWKFIKNNKPNSIFVYSMHLPFIIPAIIGKLFFSSQLTIMIPDLPIFMRHSMNIVIQILKKIDYGIQKLLIRMFDKYILVTTNMVSELKIENKNLIIIDGMVNTERYLGSSFLDDFNLISENYILYSGTIEIRYGIDRMIDAYLKTSMKTKLVLCGSGSYVDEIKKISSTHNNIIYLGNINTDKLIQLQLNALAVINPRSNKEAFTKFSFPSKTLEYLASKNIIIMEKLPGMECGYDEFILEINNGNIIEAFESLFKMDNDEIIKKGELAQEFVIKEKDYQIQSKRILDFIEGVV